jgi:hypothetical protein
MSQQDEIRQQPKVHQTQCGGGRQIRIVAAIFSRGLMYQMSGEGGKNH